MVTEITIRQGQVPLRDASLLSGPVENMIAAPKSWCPNPTTTSCLRVRGNSMAPIIQDGYVIAVDYSQNDLTLLKGKIVIAWNRDKGITVSRFKRYDHTEVLEPENRGYESITLSTKNRWKYRQSALVDRKGCLRLICPDHFGLPTRDPGRVRRLLHPGAASRD